MSMRSTEPSLARSVWLAWRSVEASVSQNERYRMTFWPSTATQAHNAEMTAAKTHGDRLSSTNMFDSLPLAPVTGKGWLCPTWTTTQVHCCARSVHAGLMKSTLRIKIDSCPDIARWQRKISKLGRKSEKYSGVSAPAPKPFKSPVGPDSRLPKTSGLWALQAKFPGARTV
jgi:hypothetical protein